MIADKLIAPNKDGDSDFIDEFAIEYWYGSSKSFLSTNLEKVKELFSVATVGRIYVADMLTLPS